MFERRHAAPATHAASKGGPVLLGFAPQALEDGARRTHDVEVFEDRRGRGVQPQARCTGLVVVVLLMQLMLLRLLLHTTPNPTTRPGSRTRRTRHG